MKDYAIIIERTGTGFNNKISDIRDFRAMFVDPTMDRCTMPLSQAKLAVEQAYATPEDVTVCLNAEQFAAYMHHRYNGLKLWGKNWEVLRLTIYEHPAPVKQPVVIPVMAYPK